MRKSIVCGLVFLMIVVGLVACNGGGGGDPAPSYSISGAVTSSGSGLPDVTVTLSGSSSATATTDSSGKYTFAGLSNGNYTITPGKSGYTFNPTSSAQTVNGADLVNVNFTGVTTYQVMGAPVRTTWPIVREASGQWELVGETFIINTGAEKLVLQSVNLKVFEAAGNILADRTYDSGKFDDMIIIVMKNPDGTYTQTSTSTSELEPGELCFSHVAALAGNASLPTLARVTISFTNGKSETTDIPLYEFNPGEQTIWPLTFSGGDWLAFDTGETTYHWRDINFNPAINAFVIDQRYAIDAVQFDSQYNLSNPFGSTHKEDYYAWGEDIMSVGSGTVVTVVQDQIDQEMSKVWTSTDTHVEGNYVVIQHGPALFSLYAHMMQNSAIVSVGAHVAAGQVIGKIGNSGLTGNIGAADGMPQLHFQYMDAEDRTKAQGLPAVFWNAKVIRHSDADILGAFQGYLPDIRSAYDLQAGTYTMNGNTPLEYDIVTSQ